MQLVQYLKDKFNPSRPMGRKNYFLSSLAFAIVFVPVVWYLPGMDQLPAPPFTIILLQVFNAPFWMLNFRRANAAAIPIGIIAFAWLLTPINLATEGGGAEAFINTYQFVLALFLLFKRNKVEPVTP